MQLDDRLLLLLLGFDLVTAMFPLDLAVVASLAPRVLREVA